MLDRAEPKRPSRTAWALFFLPPVPVHSGAGIFFLENKSMNFVWLAALGLVGLAYQSSADKKGNSKGDAPRLAPLARGDNSSNADLAGNRVRHSYVQTIHAPADRVFAVLEPVAEVEWAPGFEYRWVYAHDGERAKSGQEGDVFVTQHHSGLGSQGTAVWVMSGRDAKERRVQFVRFIADYQVTQIDVHVVPHGKQSKCEVTYTYTALSDRGREALKQITKEHYEEQMKEWEQQVNDYLSRR
jgi:hypothetical protein